jgi:hypothetical protein
MLGSVVARARACVCVARGGRPLNLVRYAVRRFEWAGDSNATFTGRDGSDTFPGYNGRPPLVIQGDSFRTMFHSDGMNSVASQLCDVCSCVCVCARATLDVWCRVVSSRLVSSRLVSGARCTAGSQTDWGFKYTAKAVVDTVVTFQRPHWVVSAVRCRRVLPSACVCITCVPCPHVAA